MKFTIRWGDRSRAMQGPSSALSATVTLEGAKPGGGDFSFTINRATESPAYTETYSSTNKATTGAHRFTIRFFSRTNGKGEEVAKGGAKVTIKGDGTGIGDVAVANRIKSVKVEADQTVKEGKTVFLGFSAMDASGALVPVSRGSSNWNLIAGERVISLTYDGQATGIKAGVATVRVRVDGVTNSATVAVPSPGTGGDDFADAGFETPELESGKWKENDALIGTPWTGDASHGIANGRSAWGSQAHKGEQYGYIQDPGSLEQSVGGLKVGRKYRVRFWIARRDGDSGANQGTPIEVYADKVKIAKVEPTEDGVFHEIVTDNFFAQREKVRFKFKSVLVPHQDRSTLLDDVHLEEAP